MSYITDIQHQIDAQLKTVEEMFEGLSGEVYNQRPSEKKWSARECLAHLNRTLLHYNPHIHASIAKSRTTGQSPNLEYNPGFLGERLTRMMAPRNGVIRMKVRTMGSFQPATDETYDMTLKEFRQLMEELRGLVDEAGTVDLGRTRVKTPFVLRLKLGDTFPYVLAHNERHLLQAQRALEAAQRGLISASPRL